MTYKEFQESYSKAYEEADMMSAKLAALDEEYRALDIPDKKQLDYELSRVNTEVIRQYEPTGECHIICEQKVVETQINEIVNDHGGVNYSTINKAADITAEKQALQTELAKHYIENNVGNIVPAVEAERNLIMSQQIEADEANHRLQVYDAIINSMGQIDMTNNGYISLSERTDALLTATNHLSRDGIQIDAETFSQHFANSVNADMKNAVNSGIEPSDVLKNIKNSISESEHIDSVISKAASESVDAVMVKEESAEIIND